jgi:uncharacterized protein (TIGR02271 family)
MKGVSVVCDNGKRGKVIDQERAGYWIVEFNDGSRMVVSEQAITYQNDGTYYLALGTATDARNLTAITESNDDMVIQVLAEELNVQKEQIERSKVRVNKRIETREETVDVPVIHEEVVVERVPINKLVEDIVPEARHEDGVIVIPLIEEVLVVEKRLLIREEVRVSKQRKTENVSQSVTLRREVVDVERVDLGDAASPTKQG